MSVSPEDRDRYERPSRRRESDEIPPKKSNQSLLLIVVSVVISFLAIMIWTNVSVIPKMLTKADFETNINNMVADIGKMQSSIGSIQNSVTTSLNNIPNAVTTQVNTVMSSITNQLNTMQNTVNDLKSQVSSYGSRIDSAVSGVSILSAKVDALTNSNSDLSAKITALQTQLTADEARIKVLETKTVTPTTPTSVITAKVKSTSNVLAASDNHTLVGSFRVTLTNSSVSDVNDLILDVETQTDTILGSHVAYLSGGGTSWQRQGYDPTYTDFINGTWGLTVAANSTVTLYLTLTITDSGTVDYIARYGSTGVPYMVSASVQ